MSKNLTEDTKRTQTRTYSRGSHRSLGKTQKQVNGVWCGKCMQSTPKLGGVQVVLRTVQSFPLDGRDSTWSHLRGINF